jgi:hypothetical protein
MIQDFAGEQTGVFLGAIAKLRGGSRRTKAENRTRSRS